MILVDTSVWIDHLNTGDQNLRALLDSEQVVIHPFVVGEIMLGRVRRRGTVLNLLWRLPRIDVVTDHEVVRFIDDHRLFGIGVGYVDVHLLAVTRMTPDTALWTRDERVRAAAERLGLAWRPRSN